MSGPHYTDAEQLIIRRHYGKIPLDQILEMMPGRSRAGVKEWARRRGLRSELGRKRHTRRLPDEFYEQILREVAADKFEVVALNHGVPTGTVSGWVARAKAYLYGKKSPADRDQRGGKVGLKEHHNRSSLLRPSQHC